jgi:hypothetical protein
MREFTTKSNNQTPLARSLVAETKLLVAHILHVDIGPETDVVGEVPAVVIRVVVDYDLIGAPIPVTAVAEIVRRYAEEESVKPEAVGASSAKAPDVPAANSTRKASIRPGTIEMIMRVTASRVMANPLVTPRVYVRSIGMAPFVAVRRPIFGRSAVIATTSAIRGRRSTLP